MSDADSALEIAAAFLLQSPPGELADVYADLTALVAPLLPSGEAQLEAALRPALAQYAREQLTIVDLEGEGGKGKTLLTEASRVEGDDERHVAPGVGSSFEWDAVKATATSVSPLSPTPDPDTEALRASLDTLLKRYTANHYAEGVSAVFALDDPAYPPPAPAAATPPPPPATTTAAAADAPAPAPETEQSATAAEGQAAADAAETADAAAAALPDEGVETANGEAAPPAAEEAAAEAQAQNEAQARGEGEGAVEGEEQEQAGEDAEMSAATPAAAPSGEDDEPAAAPQEQEQEPAQEESAAPATARPSRLFGLYLVGNKFNPGNYWTGRWRSTYTLDWAKGTLEGTAKVNIHYYEQGNVQLSTTLKSTTPLSASPPAEAVVAALKASESSFQRQLGDTYAHLSDGAFKGLRRALPKTRSKVDWDKAGAYRLGGQIGGGQQAQA